jgi:hypothetical protein
MNRRQFLTSISAVAAPAASAAQPAQGAGERLRVSLNGIWDRYVGETLVDRVEAPSSLRPSGFYRLERSIVLPKPRPDQRAFAHFEAINFHGRLFCNGTELGTTIPYVPHEFEITRHIKEGANLIQVSIADLCPGPAGEGADEVWLGVNPGWEAYGGIIRDSWIEFRPATFIDNVRFTYRLSHNYREAACRATAFVSSPGETGGRVEIVVRRGASEIARASNPARIPAGAGTIELEFPLQNPTLWSPEEPNLYTITAVLGSDSGTDQWSCQTGFRDIAIRRNRFELNGSRLILNGVCRHDMWKDQGFTLTRAQMEQDMRAIKALGANFVRLVHYPHDRHIIELADFIGLLVSEENGYWNMDFRTMPRSRAALGIRIMEATVRRDWNSPAVMAWLLGNESTFTVDYLRKAREACRALDVSARPVGVANSMRKEDARPVLEQSGMDFFDDHPYTFNVAEFEKIAEFYGPGKPLLFTEWGGKEIGQSEMIMPRTVDKLAAMVESGALSGHVFWSWQDLPQFSRMDAEMRDGILESGVVTEGREPRQFVYMELQRLFERRPQVSLPAMEAPAILPLGRSPWSPRTVFYPVDLASAVSGERGRHAWSDFENRMAVYWKKMGVSDQWDRTGRRFLLWRDPELEILGARFLVPVVDGYVRPVVLTPEFPEAEIPVGRKCRALHFLGQVTCPGGYPPEGTAGDTVAAYEIRNQSGVLRRVPLRAGYEVARANVVHVATRVNPVATAAQRAFCFAKDWAREQYQGLLFSVPLGGHYVQSVGCRLAPDQPPLLLFAAAAELEQVPNPAPDIARPARSG